MQAVMLILLCFVTEPGVEVIAHRGESHDAPENTLAAFQLAWERGVSAIELDVHQTSDGHLIVCHDGDTTKTTGAKLSIANSKMTELRKLDAGRWKGERWAGEKLPLLSEALATIPDDGRCYIEIKVGPEAVPALVDVIKASGKSPRQTPIISFNAETITEAKRRLPQHETYWIVAVRPDERTGRLAPPVRELIAKARAINADGLDLSVPPLGAYVQPIKNAGLKCYVWTINDPDEARRYVELGVDGVTTDRAAWLRGQLLGDAPSIRAGN